MDSNISNDGRFEQHIIDSTAQARQAALESKKYAGIAVKAAEAASGGSLSGVARVDDCNVFTKTNTFGACTVFNGLARFAGYAQLCRQASKNGGERLYNYNGYLYWGCSKLSCTGDVYACLDNVFTGTNTFAKVLFTCTVDFKGGASFNGSISLSCEKDVKSCNVLYNYNSDLYWGAAKLNGGGDVRAAGHNVFTGSNKFNECTGFHGGAGFYGCTDFNNSVTFYSGATFNGQVNIGESEHQILFLGDCIQVVSCSGDVLGHASYEAFGNFLNTLHS